MRRLPNSFRWFSILVLVAAGILVSRVYRQPLPVYADTITVPQSSGCQTYQGSFLDTTAPAMLRRLGVVFYSEDTITAFPDPGLGIGAAVTVCSAPDISITDAGSTRTVRSWVKTVSDLVQQQRIDLGEKDLITPSLDAPITSGLAVAITRVAETNVYQFVSLTPPVQYQDDATLDKGVTRVQQEGVAGQRKDTYLERRENGLVVSHKKVGSEVVKAAIPQIIIRGTRVLIDSGIASWYGGVGALTAAHRTLPLGTVVRVTNTDSGASVVVTIRDRGPFVAGRVIDLSKDAFAAIASIGSGVAHIRIDRP